MIKFQGETHEGKALYGFGLSDANLRKLREGHLIHIDLAVMGGQGEVLIFWGRTEADMSRELWATGLISPEVEHHNQEAVQPGEFEEPERKGGESGA